MTVARIGVRARVAAALVIATVATSLLFGFMAFAFVYSLEDRIYDTALREEVDRQQMAWRDTRRLIDPALPYVEIYRAGDRLPADLASQFDAAGTQSEYPGTDSRHYHVARFDLPDAGGRAVAVAEVSRTLLVRPRRDTMIGLLAGMGLTTALLAALLGWWLANRALAPLTALAADMTRSGTAVPRIDAAAYPANEIGALADALAGAFDRLRGFIAREQSFTRDASHELRTPVAVVWGAADVLALREDLSGPAREAVERIRTAAADMTQTIDLLLALAREGQSPTVERTVLLPLVEKAIAMASHRFQSSPIDVVVTPAVGPMTVMVSPSLTQLVLNNLIANAFQHAAASRLTISAEGNVLVISDGGPGMAPGDAAFSPFVRGEDSAGSGLGLAIVQRLCAEAGVGLAWRTAPAAGTEFRLTFQQTC